MSISQMKSCLLKWNPHWKKETINKWKDKQILAIYTKELSKQPKSNIKYEQLSFL